MSVPFTHIKIKLGFRTLNDSNAELNIKDKA